MSSESASKFISQIYERDGDTLALLPKGVVPEGIGAKEVAAIAKAAKLAGWDFTADELQEAYLDSLDLNESELRAVAGGGTEICPQTAQEPHRGGCTSNYYAEACLDTVSDQDGCWCTDWDACADHYHKC